MEEDDYNDDDRSHMERNKMKKSENKHFIPKMEISVGYGVFMFQPQVIDCLSYECYDDDDYDGSDEEYADYWAGNVNALSRTAILLLGQPLVFSAVNTSGLHSPNSEELILRKENAKMNSRVLEKFTREPPPRQHVHECLSQHHLKAV
ncbi:hypothetical protein GQ457_06G022830 [Hibiscus cannabinus]